MDINKDYGAESVNLVSKSEKSGRPGIGIQLTHATGTGQNIQPSIADPGWVRPPVVLTEHEKLVERNVLAFRKKSVRLGFTRKVYGILAVQLLISAGIISIFMFHKVIKAWVPENLGFIAAVGAVVLVSTIIVSCADSLRRRCCFFLNRTRVILYGVGMTVTVCLTLALFSVQNKINYNLCTGFVVSSLVLAIVVTTLIMLQRNDFIEMEFRGLVITCVGALLLTLLFVVDVTRIMGGWHSCAVSPNENVLGAITIYLDIFMIFVAFVASPSAVRSNWGAGGAGYYDPAEHQHYGEHCCFGCSMVETSSTGSDSHNRNVVVIEES